MLKDHSIRKVKNRCVRANINSHNFMNLFFKTAYISLLSDLSVWIICVLSQVYSMLVCPERSIASEATKQPQDSFVSVCTVSFFYSDLASSSSSELA